MIPRSEHARSLACKLVKITRVLRTPSHVISVFAESRSTGSSRSCRLCNNGLFGEHGLTGKRQKLNILPGLESVVDSD